MVNQVCESNWSLCYFDGAEHGYVQPGRLLFNTVFTLPP
jgi:hypothetical protein